MLVQVQTRTFSPGLQPDPNLFISSLRAPPFRLTAAVVQLSGRQGIIGGVLSHRRNDVGLVLKDNGEQNGVGTPECG